MEIKPGMMFDTKLPDGSIIERDLIVKELDDLGNIVADDSDGIECLYSEIMMVNIREGK